MNFSIAALFLSLTASCASAGLLQNARRLNDDANANEYAFLGGYSLKLLSCKTDVGYVNPTTGAAEYDSIVFRLCPTTGTCADDTTSGCGAGYGDYVVGINTFVAEYLDQKRDEMQVDDAFKVEDLGECRQYEADKDGDAGDDATAYYVGPACSSDGKSVRVALYKDACQTLSDSVSFEDLSNGISLPYSTGGLVSNYCESCMVTDDNGDTALADMCLNLYGESGKCETKMETFHYSGKVETGCEAVSALLPRKSKSSGGKVVGWLFFVLVVIGVGAFAFTAMKKKKDDKAFGLMS